MLEMPVFRTELKSKWARFSGRTDDLASHLFKHNKQEFTDYKNFGHHLVWCNIVREEFVLSTFQSYRGICKSFVKSLNFAKKSV